MELEKDKAEYCILKCNLPDFQDKSSDTHSIFFISFPYHDDHGKIPLGFRALK